MTEVEWDILKNDRTQKAAYYNFLFEHGNKCSEYYCGINKVICLSTKRIHIDMETGKNLDWIFQWRNWTGKNLYIFRYSLIWKLLLEFSQQENVISHSENDWQIMNFLVETSWRLISNRVFIGTAGNLGFDETIKIGQWSFRRVLLSIT